LHLVNYNLLNPPIFNYGDVMPKLKTKSGVKKRFKISGTGKVLSTQSGKRHGMRKRTKGQLRSQRGMATLNTSDAGIVNKFTPYGLD
jgi:large subunit ribosomal protein L35